MAMFDRLPGGLGWTALLAVACSSPPPADAPVTTEAPAAGEPHSVPTLAARPLTGDEQRIVAHVDEHAADAIAFLQRVVDINSGTRNLSGVREVGALYESRLAALGLRTRWIDQAEVDRAGHLFAETGGTAGKRLLVIGHLDTVFTADSPFQRYELLADGWARGPGVIDAKGGNTVILYALEALHAAGALADIRVVVALTGDEELTGQPLSASRKDLVAAAKQSDVALGFEPGVGGANSATVARRGFTAWNLDVRGKPGHSSRIFSDQYGAGAVFEAARILQAFYDQLRGEKYVTFNAAIIAGGTDASYTSAGNRAEASGKTNVIPQTVAVVGELRTLTVEQRERVKERMREIAGRNLHHTSAELRFRDTMPPMAPTPGNHALLRQLDQVGRDLGLGPITTVGAGERGAADISFAAPHADSLAGLGPHGRGSHTDDESVYLPSLAIATKRTALLIYRLTR